MLHTIISWIQVEDMVLYLFKLRHLVPRPNFEGVSLFKNSKDQSIIIIAHDSDLDYEPRSPEHLTF